MSTLLALASYSFGRWQEATVATRELMIGQAKMEERLVQITARIEGISRAFASSDKFHEERELQ